MGDHRTKPEAVTPPGQYAKQCGMHWLRRRLFGSAGNEDLIALQWNPGSRTWTHCDGQDSAFAEKFDTAGWEYIQPIPYPILV